MKAVEVAGRTVYVEPLKFKDFVRLIDLITKISEDAEKGKLNLSAYLTDALPLISSMTNLKTEEIENLKASEALKLLEACIEVLLEDRDFFKNLKNILSKVNEALSQSGKR